MEPLTPRYSSKKTYMQAFLCNQIPTCTLYFLYSRGVCFLLAKLAMHRPVMILLVPLNQNSHSLFFLFPWDSHFFSAERVEHLQWLLLHAKSHLMHPLYLRVSHAIFSYSDFTSFLLHWPDRRFSFNGVLNISYNHVYAIMYISFCKYISYVLICYLYLKYSQRKYLLHIIYISNDENSRREPLRWSFFFFSSPFVWYLLYFSSSVSIY